MSCNRKALVVGIDYYDVGCHLHGCVNDARRMQSVLERNEDGSVNFAVKSMLASDEKNSNNATSIERICGRTV